MGTEAPGAHLLEPLDLVLQLHLAGPGTELAQARGRAATPARPLAVQLVHLQVFQLLPQVLDELRGREAGWWRRGCGREPWCPRLWPGPTSCVASRSFWNSRRFCRSLSIMRLYRSVSSLSRRLVSSSRSDMRCRSWGVGEGPVRAESSQRGSLRPGDSEGVCISRLDQGAIRPAPWTKPPESRLKETARSLRILERNTAEKWPASEVLQWCWMKPESGAAERKPTSFSLF